MNKNINSWTRRNMLNTSRDAMVLSIFYPEFKMRFPEIRLLKRWKMKNSHPFSIWSFIKSKKRIKYKFLTWELISSERFLRQDIYKLQSALLNSCSNKLNFPFNPYLFTEKRRISYNPPLVLILTLFNAKYFRSRV